MNRLLKTAAALMLGICMMLSVVVTAYAEGENMDGEPFFVAKAESLDKPIRAGDEGYLDVTIESLGVGTTNDIYVEITPPEDITLLDGTNTKIIRGGILLNSSRGRISIHYKAKDRITTESLLFNLTLKYLSDDEYGMMTSFQTTFSVASEISVVDRVYPVVMCDFSLSEKEISPNTEYSGTIKIKNVGTADMKGVFVNLSGGDSFVITDGTGSAFIPEIKMNSEYKLPVKIKTLNEISTIKQDLAMSLQYTYIQGSEERDATYEQTFTMFAPISNGGTPMPRMSLKTLEDPISSGHRYKYYLIIENTGTVDMENVRINMKGSEGIIFVNATDSTFVEKISSGAKKSILVNFQTSADMTSPNQSISVDLNYSYKSAGKTEQGSDSAVLSVDAAVSGAPVVRVYGDTKNSVIVPNAEYEYTMIIRNFGDIPVKDVYIDFTPSDALYFIDGTEYAHINTIKADSSAEVTVKFRTTANIGSLKQTITAALNYVYGTTSAANHGEAQGTVTLIAAGASEGGNVAAPNLIIGSYDIGAEQIAAGDSFNLELDFYNTSADTKIENIIMTINAGGEIGIFGGANTYYYPTLGAASALHESVALRALATAQTGTSQVSISFKYDYLDGSQRNTATSEQTIFIPVYQPDKMTFDVNVPTWTVYTGNEVYITTSYLNKGRCDISNVKAEIVGDVGALSTSKIIGNVAPGGNGTFDFIVTPYMSGECNFTILITYEDATLTEVSREIPVNFFVEEMMWEDPGMWEEPMLPEEPEEGEKFPWLILWIGIGVVVVGAVVTIICVVAHKKKKKKLAESEIDWEDDDIFDDTHV